MWVVLLASIYGKLYRNNMVDFRDKKRIETRGAVLNVDAGLPVGRYVFQLTVVDKAGNSSVPTRIKVEIFNRFIITEPVLIDPISPTLTVPFRPIG